MIHQIWSGTTKSIRQNCHVQNLPIEFPGLGFFVPRFTSPERGRLTQDALIQVDDSSEVIFVVDSKFSESNGLQIGNKNGIIVSQETAEQSPEIMALMNNLTRLNYSSIANVCCTDSSSVELVLKEIIAQMSAMIKQNATLRISFRIGRIEIKNQEINWK